MKKGDIVSGSGIVIGRVTELASDGLVTVQEFFSSVSHHGISRVGLRVRDETEVAQLIERQELFERERSLQEAEARNRQILLERERVLQEAKAKKIDMEEARHAGKVLRLGSLSDKLNQVVAQQIESILKRAAQAGDLRTFDAIVNKLPEEFREQGRSVKDSFVKSFFERLGVALDDAQVDAITSNAIYNKVTARAGSGKTRLLTAKAFYLIRFYGVAPSQILILAFNRDAAKEVRERMNKLYGISSFSTARTFHSLAYQICNPQEQILADNGRDPSQAVLSRFIQEIIREVWNPLLLKRLHQFFRRECQELDATGTLFNKTDYLRLRREMPQITLNGDIVKSIGEKFIGDFLFEHGIDHRYEQSVRWGKQTYHPDFVGWQGKGEARKKFVIEHWAFDPDGLVPQPSVEWPAETLERYLTQISEKRRFWISKGAPLIETHAGLLGSGREQFEEILRRLLERLGIGCVRLSDEEIGERVQRIHVTRLSRTLAQFIQRAQNGFDNLHQLGAYGEEYAQKRDSRERFFIRLGLRMLEKYFEKLMLEDKTDFNQLFPRAVAQLHKSQVLPLLNDGGDVTDINDLAWIMVDEAQDLSPQYIKLLKEIRRQRPKVRMMFVGDDWQAINRFAGSDVEIFTNLAMEFPGVTEFSLESNFRSCASIVELGNMLMGGVDGPLAVSKSEVLGTIENYFLDDLWMETRQDLSETPEFKADQFFRFGDDWMECRKNDPGEVKSRLLKAVLLICGKHLAEEKEVGVIFRTGDFHGTELVLLKRKLSSVLKRLKAPKKLRESFNLKVRFGTAHSFKGLEMDLILVVFPHEGSFPLLHPDTALFGIFGDSMERALEDERRLFYVAISRAKERLAFISLGAGSEERPFLAGAEQSVLEKRFEPLSELQEEWARQFRPEKNPAAGEDAEDDNDPMALGDLHPHEA